MAMDLETVEKTQSLTARLQEFSPVSNSRRGWPPSRLWTMCAGTPPTLLALVLVVATTRRALSGIDVSWDAIAYHLPFIALRTGFVAPSEYHPGRLAADLLRYVSSAVRCAARLLWKVSGRVEAVNLFGLISLLLTVLYVRFRYAVSVNWILIGLFAIPAVQTAVASAYVDVAANAYLLIVVLSVCEVWIDNARVRSWGWWLTCSSHPSWRQIRNCRSAC